jgi:hypothetical protein
VAGRTTRGPVAEHRCVGGHGLHPLHRQTLEIEHLAYDVQRRPSSAAGLAVLTVGVGGHDILSAILFKRPHITGVELNGNIRAPSTACLATTQAPRPASSIAPGQRRSPRYIARTSDVFDITRSSIDTWAATSAGAFVLSENALPPSKPGLLYADRLSPKGV